MPLTLKDLGYAVGDLVTYDSNDDNTGGVVFEIRENYDSPVPDNERGRWGRPHHDASGKKLERMQVMGYVRLRPVFKFFPTERGSNPRGKAGTVLVHHTAINHECMKKVDLVVLASKYAELGNLVRDIAIRGGMELEPTQEV